MQQLIDKNDLIDVLTEIKSNRGYWIYMNKESNSNFSGAAPININYANLKKGWHLLGSQEILDTNNTLKENNISLIWKYSNNSWKAVSADKSINNKIKEKYGLIDSIDSSEGFWLLK